jgi:thiol-disulfide isomerase/thioredoxin
VQLSTISVALLFLMGVSLLPAQQSVAQRETYVVAYTQAAVRAGDLSAASSIVEQYRKSYGDTPAAIEAFSWIGRGQLDAGNSDAANENARRTMELCEAALKTRSLDAEPHLPLALGASYEIQANVLHLKREKSQAVALIQSALKRWAGTSLVPRLRKNLNLLTIEGRPAPALVATDWIGARPPALSALRGKVVVVFFWAHWCPDCRADAPIMAKLGAEFEPKGLAIIGPTKLYGFAAGGDEASPAEERQYIKKVFNRFYAEIPHLFVPVGEKNFDTYGASTTPTIVLIDRRGIVRLYHPGAMAEAELRSAIEKLL